MLKFQGSLDNLQDIAMRCAIPGEWSFHKKSHFYRFQATTGAILNWWPTTGTMNFQGRNAEQLEAAFLKHAFVGEAQSEPGLVCEEPVWEVVPGPTPPPNGSREAPSFAGTEKHRRIASPPARRLVPRTAKLLASPDRDHTGA
jgi:hypothetical protein